MAAGNTLLTLLPAHAIPPASNYATEDMRNLHPVLDFDAATEESILFQAVLPRHYAGGGITIYIHWMASSATSGDVRWAACFERNHASGDDLDSDSFASEQAATGTAAGTNGVVTRTSIAFTDGAQLDSLAAGDAFRLKVSRKAADGADTMSGDAELLAVEVRETP